MFPFPSLPFKLFPHTCPKKKKLSTTWTAKLFSSCGMGLIHKDDDFISIVIRNIYFPEEAFLKETPTEATVFINRQAETS